MSWREGKSSSERGYDSRWRKARATFLSRNPLCAECARFGITTEATIVDHSIPHRGDSKLFWDTSLWRPMCKPCHDSFKQRLEKSGYEAGGTGNGIPTDPNHHWNK